MADLQKLPIQAKEVIGADVYAVPTVTERVPSGRTMFDPYRILTVSGEKQQDVQNFFDNASSFVWSEFQDCDCVSDVFTTNIVKNQTRFTR